jgi:hypothetical protein
LRPGPSERRIPAAWRGPVLTVEMFCALSTLGEEPDGGSGQKLDQPVN